MCIELCAGSARLAAALKKKGFATLAVEHSKIRPRQVHPTISIDLANDESVSQLLKLFDTLETLVFVHVAPPFGTASSTRGKKLKRAASKQGAQSCRPLRSKQCPEGLPGLGDIEQTKVSVANSIYKNICKFLEVLPDSVIICIENPRRSHFWSTKWVKSVISKKRFFPVEFQQCCHGGRRDSWTRLYVNHNSFQNLRATCDGSHSHPSWKVQLKRTSEAAYPELLCTRIADIISLIADHGGILPPVTAGGPSGQAADNVAKLRAAQSGRQPRGNLLPQIIPEFQEIVKIPFPSPGIPPGLLTVEQAQLLGVRFPAKLLDSKRGQAQEGLGNFAEVGIYRTPEEFVLAAQQLRHPFDDDTTVSDGAKRAIFGLLTDGPAHTANYRESVFRY